jgi:hypothetical protein
MRWRDQRGACSALSVVGLLEIKKKLLSPRNFWIEFADRDGIADDVEEMRCAKCTAGKWATVTPYLAADLHGVMTGAYFEDFKVIATESAMFSDYLEEDADGCLHNAMRKSRSCLIAAPIPSTVATVVFDSCRYAIYC